MRGQIIINISQGEKNFRATSPVSMRCGNAVKEKTHSPFLLNK